MLSIPISYNRSSAFVMNNKHHNFFIISTIDFSQTSAASTRMLYYAKALANEETEVYLISCCSDKLKNNRFVEPSRNVFVPDNMNITINFFSTFFFLRRLNRFSESKASQKTFILYPTAFVFLELLTVLYLKFFKGYTVFYELNEVRKHISSYQAPMSFKRIGYSFKKIIFRVLFTFTQPLLFCYDGLVCISTEIEKYGKKFNKNTLRIPILTDPCKEIKISEEEYFTKGNFNIGFAGSIHPIKEDLDNFIGIVKKLKDKGFSVSFNLCGAIFKTYNEDFLRLCNLREELTYYGFLNDLEMSTFLEQQNVLVLPRGYSLQNKYGFSTKLSDYLNHKKIILVTDVSDNKLYIEDGVNGFIVPPNDSQAMYKKLMYIIQNFKAIEKTVTTNAHKVSLNEFDYRLYSQPLRKFLATSTKRYHKKIRLSTKSN